MNNRRTGVVLASLLVLAPVMSAPAPAQEVCRVESKSNVGYQVDIDGTKYLAISRAAADEALACKGRLASTEERLRQAEALNQKAEAVIAEVGKSNELLKQHVVTLNEQIEDLKKAKEKLEAMMGIGGLAFEAGVGVTNDGDAAGLVGAGYGRWQAWGYVQEGGTSGVLVGIRF